MIPSYSTASSIYAFCYCCDVREPEQQKSHTVLLIRFSQWFNKHLLAKFMCYHV